MRLLQHTLQSKKIYTSLSSQSQMPLAPAIPWHRNGPHTWTTIILPESLLRDQVEHFRERALTGKFWKIDLLIDDTKSWASQNWLGLSDVFWLNIKLGYFLPKFDSSKKRDVAYKYKIWFCKGSGLFTSVWTLNVLLDSSSLLFFFIWIALPRLPLKYRDLEIIEITANRLFCHFPFIRFQRDI